MVNKRVNIVSLKLVKESSVSYCPSAVNSSAAAYQLMSQLIEDNDRETFVVVCLDTKLRPTNISITAIGTLNSSVVHPREVFKVAIMSNASSIIVGHNHPSGELTPSNEDVDVTRKLLEASKVLGIPILDHVIVGDRRFISLKEKGLM